MLGDVLGVAEELVLDVLGAGGRTTLFELPPHPVSTSAATTMPQGNSRAVRAALILVTTTPCGDGGANGRA